MGKNPGNNRFEDSHALRDAVETLRKKNTSYKSYDGSEYFYSNGTNLFTVLDMWRYSYSQLLSQVGEISEFLVARALGIKKAENVSYWTAYDMTYREKRIEIKGTAYVHAWNSKRVSKIRTFSIAPSKNAYWESEFVKNSDELLSRQSDVYVFCLNTCKDINTFDPLNVDNWRFFVLPTQTIDEYAGKTQKTIGLNVVERLAERSVGFHELRVYVDKAIDMINKEKCL